jgi:hypothetical protein
LIQAEPESGPWENDQTMQRKRHTEEQIITILKEHEAGMKTADLLLPSGEVLCTSEQERARQV